MSDAFSIQQAADEARNAARKAQELADLLNDYASCLMKPDLQGRASELHAMATTKLSKLQENLRKSNELMQGKK